MCVTTATTCPCAQGGSGHSVRAAPCHPPCKGSWGRSGEQHSDSPFYLPKQFPPGNSQPRPASPGQGIFPQPGPHTGLCARCGLHGGERGNFGRGQTRLGQVRSLSPRRALPKAQPLAKAPAHLGLPGAVGMCLAKQHSGDGTTRIQQQQQQRGVNPHLVVHSRGGLASAAPMADTSNFQPPAHSGCLFLQQPGPGTCSQGCSLPAGRPPHGEQPHVRRAVSRPSSLRKPGGEGRAALQGLDTQPEAAQAHREAGEGREKQERAGDVQSLWADTDLG